MAEDQPGPQPFSIGSVPEELRRSSPHLEPMWQLFDGLNKESPRGRVLISAGLLEQQLRDVLDAFMVQGRGAESLLDGANAPLGTFSARIAACHALALVTDDERHDLDIIRKVRNEFAHKIETTFETPRVRDMCNNLRLILKDYTHPAGHEVKFGPHDHFEASTVSLILGFTTRAHFVQRERRWIRPWPYYLSGT